MTDNQDIARMFNEELLQKRTTKQNKSLHLGCTQLAKTLNDAGIDQKKVLQNVTLELPNTMYSIKGIIKAVALTMYGTNKTSELNTKQLSKVWEVVMYNLTKIYGSEVYIPFPSQEEKYFNNQ